MKTDQRGRVQPNRGRVWTQEEKDEIYRMRLNRAHSADIAVKFGVTPGQVSVLAAEWGLPVVGSTEPRKPAGKYLAIKRPRATPITGHTRKCLSCRREFQPEARTIFICDRCKQSDVWLSRGV